MIEHRSAVTTGQGYGKGIDCKGPEGTFWGDEHVVYLDCGGRYTNTQSVQLIELYT